MQFSVIFFLILYAANAALCFGSNDEGLENHHTHITRSDGKRSTLLIARQLLSTWSQISSHDDNLKRQQLPGVDVFSAVEPTFYPSQSPTHPLTDNPSPQPTSFPTLTPCPAGYIMETKSNATYTAFTGSDFYCVACPKGTTSYALNNTCILCPPGTRAPTTGSSKCHLCPQNFYQPDDGSATCKSCPPNFVTAYEGSTSHSECVNPNSDFIIGWIALFFCGVLAAVYIFAGRLLRIAYYRKYRLIEASIMICGLALLATDLVLKFGIEFSLLLLQQRNKPKHGNEDNNRGTLIQRWEFVYTNIIKPLTFTVGSVFVTISSVILTLVDAILKMLFHVLVLWRGYHYIFNLPLTFPELAKLLMVKIDIYFINIHIFSWLLTPFIYVFDIISDININIASFKVNCHGAQQPWFLLISLVIMGIVIMIIKSDIQVFWSMAIIHLTKKTHRLFLNRFYVTRNFHILIYNVLLASTIVIFIPEPRKVVQYLVGFVSFSRFINRRGVSDSSDNCNNEEWIFGHNRFTVPADEILAFATTAFALLVLPAIVYVLAQVLVPTFERAKIVEAVPIPARFSGKFSSGKEPSNPNESASSNSIEEPKDYLSSDKGINSVIQDDINRKHFCRRWGTRTLRFLGILFSFDWLLLKLISVQYVEPLIKQHERFVMSNHSIMDDKNDVNDDKKEADEDEEDEESGEKDDVSSKSLSLQRIEAVRRDMLITTSAVPPLPWFPAIQDLLSEEEFHRQLHEEEKMAWRAYRGQYPSYKLLSRHAYNEMLAHSKYLKTVGPLRRIIFRIFSILPPFQMLTDDGWMIWVRVFKNFQTIGWISIGIWTNSVVEEFKLISTFRECQAKMQEAGELLKQNAPDNRSISLESTTSSTSPIHASGLAVIGEEQLPVSSNGNSSKIDDQQDPDLVRVEREKSNSSQRALNRAKFIAFISAIVSTRVVLLQLFPMLTLWSIIAVELSMCPIFVLSRKMRKMLPPLIFLNAFREARSQLRNEFGHATWPKWKEYSLGIYLIVHHSRIVQFVLIILQLTVSIILVFHPHGYFIDLMLGLTLLVLVLVGIINAGHSVLL